MEIIVNYIKNVFFIYILMTIIDCLVANKKYESYIKLMCGLILIFVLIKPLADFVIKGKSDLINFDLYEKNDIEQDVYNMIFEMQNGRNQEILFYYKSSISEKADEYVRANGYELCDIDVEIDMDTEGDDFGKIIILRLWITPDTSQRKEYASEDDLVNQIQNKNEKNNTESGNEENSNKVNSGRESSGTENSNIINSNKVNSSTENPNNESFQVTKIKNDLANFYNLSMSNIYINIIDRQ